MGDLQTILQSLFQQAQPRPDLQESEPVATFAGRMVRPGQSLQEILSRFPQGEVEQGGIAMQAPELLKQILPMTPVMAASLQSFAKRIARRFPTAAADAKGVPKVLYHGTPAVFEEFDPSKLKPGLYGKGVYLTDDPKVAGGSGSKKMGYANTRTVEGESFVKTFNDQADLYTFRREHPELRITHSTAPLDNARAEITFTRIVEPAPNVRPAFVQMNKPFDIEKRYGKQAAKEVFDAAMSFFDFKGESFYNRGALQAKAAEAFEQSAMFLGETDGHHLYKAIIDTFKAVSPRSGANEDLANAVLKRAGYDGITHVGGQISGGKAHRVYIAFDPKQVKSAFDPELVKMSTGSILQDLADTRGK